MHSFYWEFNNIATEVYMKWHTQNCNFIQVSYRYFAKSRIERVVQCQLDQKYQLAIELGLRFEDFDKLTFGHHKSYLIGGTHSEYAIQLRLPFSWIRLFHRWNLSQKIFELLGIDMAQWLEVSCENDINYDSQPDLITLESDSSCGALKVTL